MTNKGATKRIHLRKMGCGGHSLPRMQKSPSLPYPWTMTRRERKCQCWLSPLRSPPILSAHFSPRRNKNAKNVRGNLWKYPPATRGPDVARPPRPPLGSQNSCTDSFTLALVALHNPTATRTCVRIHFRRAFLR